HRKAMIHLHGFGDSEYIAKMFSHFWEILSTENHNTSLISPLGAKDILPLLSMDKDYLDDTNRSELNQASRWLQNRGEILKVFKKIEESSKVSKTDIHFHGDTEQVNIASGKNAKNIINQEDRKILLDAIKQIQEQNDLNNEQLQKITELQSQIENGKLEASFFDSFSNAFGIAGSTASIASLTPMIMKAVGIG
ncbi:MAG: hypothetical protein DSZ29_01035, partial [Aquificaceae bacterium]